MRIPKTIPIEQHFYNQMDSYIKNQGLNWSEYVVGLIRQDISNDPHINRRRAAQKLFFLQEQKKELTEKITSLQGELDDKCMKN